MMKGSVFKNEEITALLRARCSKEEESGAGDGSAGLKRGSNMAFAIFMEPHQDGDRNASFGEWLVDEAIRYFSPSPVLAHCELVAPPVPDSAGGRVHFATYLGAGGANWQNCNASDGVSFYLVDNGSRWRAVPVYGDNAVASVREAADRNVHAPYSLAMYPTSARPLRVLAGLWKDCPGHMGHCAVMTARVLKQAGIGAMLRHASAWYSPSSLYNELNEHLSTPLDDGQRASLTSVTPLKCAETIQTLLHAPMSYATVRALGDEACIDAIRSLTAKVCAAAEAKDSVASRIAQKQLGTALLRWVLLRDDGMGCGAASEESETRESAPQKEGETREAREQQEEGTLI